MFRSRWLAVVAAIAAVVGGIVAFGGLASATGTGPTITGTGGGIYVVGASFNYQLTAGASTDPFVGYNMGIVFPSTTVGGNLTQGGVTDDSGPSGDNLWGGADACGSVLDDNLAGALLPPLRADILGCASLAGSSMGPGRLGHVKFTGSAPGIAAAHMISFGPPDNGGAAAGTFTVNGDSTAQTNVLACGDGGAFVSALGFCGPLPVTGSQAWDSVFDIIAPPPNVSITKALTSASPNVAGSGPVSYLITVNNAASPATAATGVVVNDNLPAALTGTVTATPSQGTCTVSGPSNAQVVNCALGTINAGSSATITISVTTTDPNSGGSSPNNCASVTATNPAFTAPAPSCAALQIIPPAVSWSKVSTCGNGNVWIAENDNPLQSTGQCVGTQTFNEVMTNQGDPHGLGAFSFDLHYDPTQFVAPTIDMSPAIQFFCNGTGTGTVTNGVCTAPGPGGRALSCSISIPLNGIIHEACASTGTFGVGPVFTGNQVMGHVTLTPQDSLVEALRPNKENGDLSTVKDDGVTVTNTCGQPLNDGSIQPLPGQPECQGNPLQGVGPSGVLQGNPNGGQLDSTIRRLEGDVTKDCSVDVSDMQLEASKFGMSVGDLLYSTFFDVNLPLQHGDGEIDINDVQFVYGRFGSECSAPIPAQPALP